jgi:hypothetical protein
MLNQNETPNENSVLYVFNVARCASTVHYQKTITPGKT